MIPARLTRRGSKLLESTGFALGDELSDGTLACGGCDGWWDIPAGHQVWWRCIPVPEGTAEWEAYCRRCAFDHQRWSQRWIASVQRERPWVGLYLQLVRAERGDRRRRRRAWVRRFRGRA